jgi:flagellar biosynthesis/type III secretory pathway M-ring protein FliF/YscJ
MHFSPHTLSNETHHESSPEGAKTNQGHGRLSSGAIAGIVVSMVVAIALVVIALLYRRRIRRKKAEDAQDVPLENRGQTEEKDGSPIEELDHKSTVLPELNEEASPHELRVSRDGPELADSAFRAVVAELEAPDEPGFKN